MHRKRFAMSTPRLIVVVINRPTVKAKPVCNAPVVPPPPPPKVPYNLSEPSLHFEFTYGCEPEWAFERVSNDIA
jgi:hypothetical protein